MTNLMPLRGWLLLGAPVLALALVAGYGQSALA